MPHFTQKGGRHPRSPAGAVAVVAPDAGGGGVGTSWLKPAAVEVAGVGGDDHNGGEPFPETGGTAVFSLSYVDRLSRRRMFSSLHERKLAPVCLCAFVPLAVRFGSG